MRYVATTKGPGLTRMASSTLQGLVDACVQNWPAKTWTIAEENGPEILRVPASEFSQREMFQS